MIIDPADVIAIRRAADIRQESADGAGSNSRCHRMLIARHSEAPP